MSNVIGAYINKNTFINKIDARLKLFFMFTFLFLTFMPYNMPSYLFLFLTSILLLFISKIPFRQIIKLFKPFRFLIIFIILINILTIRQGEVLFEINNFIIFKESINLSIFILLRLMMILFFATILTYTTNPTDLTYALDFYLTPLKLFKIKTDEIVIMMSIALRFLPTLFLESQKLIKSQKSRGANFESRKLKDKIKTTSSMIIPLFIMSMQNGDALAESMVSRGFTLEDKKSKYKRFKLKVRDFLSIIIILFVIFLFLNVRGVNIW